ncbi:MAG: hypothetical protein QG577_2541 [Thermodesulfobacteriota bacterium]|nr:hypothetical protein [Thermodesulfobacteriota bacterium]
MLVVDKYFIKGALGHMAKTPTAGTSRQRKVQKSLVYQMKVTLRGIRPPIWRRIQVAGDTTLGRLHRILQEVMGWEESHLHEFFVHGESYSDPVLLDTNDVMDEKKARLDKLISLEKEKFVYMYDFGDSWEHQILVEKILPMDPRTNYPVCLTGKRACPPEDCGGVWGYEEMLEIIKDPGHPEYQDTLEWLGEEFAPDLFDLQNINRRLAVL